MSALQRPCLNASHVEQDEVWGAESEFGVANGSDERPPDTDGRTVLQSFLTVIIIIPTCAGSLLVFRRNTTNKYVYGKQRQCKTSTFFLGKKMKLFAAVEGKEKEREKWTQRERERGTNQPFFSKNQPLFSSIFSWTTADVRWDRRWEERGEGEKHGGGGKISSDISAQIRASPRRTHTHKMFLGKKTMNYVCVAPFFVWTCIVARWISDKIITGSLIKKEEGGSSIN